jgi:phosphate starvation-inducible protein PhoH and related proteins
MRGMTFHDSFMVLDEAQNATFDEIKMFVTRIGFNSKAVISGDIHQSDLKFEKDRGGFKRWLQFFSNNNEKNINTVILDKTDIIRNPVISRVLEVIGEW